MGDREAALRKAVEVEPWRGELRVALAGWLAAREPAEGVAEADRAIALAPWSARAHWARAVALVELRRCEEALADLERSVALRWRAPPPARDVEGARASIRRRCTSTPGAR